MTPVSSLSSKPLAASALETLWARMAEIYGHRWASAYGAEPSETWAKGLAGITPRQVADGLNACLRSADPWPPSLPQFRGMCFGVPELFAVRAELLAHLRPGASVPSPFARLVWSMLDGYRWRQSDADKADRMLREAYEQARAHVMSGGPLPEKPVAAIEQQEAPKPKPAAPETAKAALDRLAAMLGQPSLGELQ